MKILFSCSPACVHSFPVQWGIITFISRCKSQCACGCVVWLVSLWPIENRCILWYHKGETAFIPCSPASHVACNNNQLLVCELRVGLHLLAPLFLSFLLSDILFTCCVFTGTAMTPRWCTSWVRWSRGTTRTTLRGARSKATPCPLTCASCTPTTCSCGGSCTPNLWCLYCSRPTGTLLSAAAS